MDERSTAERLALENALSLLVRLLDEKGVLPRREFQDILTASGTSLVMSSSLSLTQQVGREMVEIAKRI